MCGGQALEIEPSWYNLSQDSRLAFTEGSFAEFPAIMGRRADPKYSCPQLPRSKLSLGPGSGLSLGEVVRV